MIRIEEAIAFAKLNGRKVTKKEIAERIWPNSNPASQSVSMTRLINGDAQRVDPEWVRIICEMTGCTADFLFNINQ